MHAELTLVFGVQQFKRSYFWKGISDEVSGGFHTTTNILTFI